MNSQNIMFLSFHPTQKRKEKEKEYMAKKKRERSQLAGPEFTWPRPARPAASCTWVTQQPKKKQPKKKEPGTGKP